MSILWTNHGEFDTSESDWNGYERAMPLSEIEGCTDLAALHDRFNRQEEQTIVIKTMLEFPDEPVDPAWFAKARAALIHFRVSNSRLERRMKRIRADLDRDRQAAKKAAA